MSSTVAYLRAKLDNPSKWTPFLLGLFITVCYLILRCILDSVYLFTWGFPLDYQPLWQDSNWWTDIVNATLIGYIPAALVTARRGIDRDLGLLRPWLKQNDSTFEKIRAVAIRTPGFTGQAFRILGFASGFLLIFIDSSTFSGSERALNNPGFVWALFRLPLFIWLICTLIVSDLMATRAYLNIGRNMIEVDLLDVRSLEPFARRGLRSALTWIIFSIIFSLFWLGDSASEQNLLLLFILLTMATTAFVVPLVGVHKKIRSVKQLELDRLRDEIRNVRSIVDNPEEMDPSSPRLANLVSYYHFIEQTKEWPIDAANLLRFFLYLILGLGSWLGGAVVERLLDSTLGT